MVYVAAPDSPHQRLTLRTLLEEPLLRQTKLFAADEDLDRFVEWCLPWSSAFDGAERITGVLVHAGILPPDADPGSLSDAVAELARRRCAALAVGTAAGLPAAVRDSAREHGLPLLAVSPDASYLAMSKLIAEKILAYDTHVMKYGARVHQALSEVLYQGAGLGAMARQISRLTDCQVLVLDSQFAVLAHEPGDGDPGVDSADIIAQVRQRVAKGEIPVVPDDHRGWPTAVEQPAADGPVTMIVSPVMLGGVTYGWLLVVETHNPPPRHDFAQHLVVAEHGATITGSEMLRLRSVMEAQERARGDFVHALLYSRFANPHELAARAVPHGFRTDAPYGVIVAQTPYVGAEAGTERRGSLLRGIQNMPGTSGYQTLTTMIGDLLVVVRQVGMNGATRGVREEEEALARFAEAVSRELNSRVEGAGGVAYGRPGVSGPGVAASYRDARVALAVAQRLDLGRVCGYSELHVYAALLELTESRQALAFATEILTPIRRGATPGLTLEQMVLAYIEAGGNLNAAARKLHVHRNTMSYQLARASRLMHMDLRNPDNLFTIWLAYRIDLLNRVNSSLAAELSPLETLMPERPS